MEAQFSCSRCRTVLSIPAGDVGKRVVCPACNANFVVAGTSDGNYTAVEAVQTTPQPRNRGLTPPARLSDVGGERPRRRETAAPETPPRPTGCAPLLGFAGVFAILIGVIVAYSVHRASNRQWTEFRGAGFRIEFPRPPAPETVELLPEGRLHTVALTFHERTWIVSYLDLPKQDQQDAPGKWLDWAEERLKQDGKAMPPRDIAIKKHPGRELFVDKNPENALSRIYVADGRLYQLSIRGIKLKGRDRSSDRFFASFQLQ